MFLMFHNIVHFIVQHQFGDAGLGQESALTHRDPAASGPYGSQEQETGLCHAGDFELVGHDHCQGGPRLRYNASAARARPRPVWPSEARTRVTR